MKKLKSTKYVERPSISKEEKLWRARDDAYTLSQAAEIAADKSRLSAAQRQARQMAAQKQQEASNLSQLGKGNLPLTKPKKRS